MSEKFCLKWNDFHSNASKSFGNLRNEEYLHDVTLVSDDHHQVSAHKLVLSACSEYFKNVFKKNNMPNAQTLLCLDGIAAEDLKNIMDYIYNGEVNIFQDSLDRFLGVAQKLKLEGLMGNEDNVQEVHDNYIENTDYAKEENVSAKTEVTNVQIPRSKTHSSGHIDNGREVAQVDKIMVPIPSEDEVKEKIKQCIETDADGNMRCTICGKEGVGAKRNVRWNLEQHIETHIEGLSYPCQLCGKTFRSRHSLNTHKSKCFQKVKFQ